MLCVHDSPLVYSTQCKGQCKAKPPPQHKCSPASEVPNEGSQVYALPFALLLVGTDLSQPIKLERCSVATQKQSTALAVYSIHMDICRPLSACVPPHIKMRSAAAAACCRGGCVSTSHPKQETTNDTITLLPQPSQCHTAIKASGLSACHTHPASQRVPQSCSGPKIGVHATQVCPSLGRCCTQGAATDAQA